MAEKYTSQYTGLKIDEAIGLALLLNSLRGGANGLATLDANKKLAQMPDASDVGAVPTERTVNGKPLSANITLNATDVGALPSTEKGQPNGLATLDETGKLPANQFPEKIVFPFGSSNSIYGSKEDGTEFSVLEPSVLGDFSVYGRGNLNKAGGGAGSGGTTYVMGHNIGFRISDMASGVQSWNPYYNRGQSFTIGIDTTGFIFSNPKYLYFVIPLYKPVVGGPTITATTGDGMIVRCNGKFAYGSSDSNKIRPASYVVSQTTTCIRIRAEFGNTTNATANTAIGVYWHGTITFS